MSNLSALNVSVDRCGDSESGSLPVDPFRSLRIHFGMLLGVDDFEVLGAYHRGKGWLHSAWLHGKGAVWGLGVSADLDEGEIRVEPGLAIDGRGRELRLAIPACVDVGAWLAEKREAGEIEIERLPDGSLRFDAHVVISFKSCLARPVPALLEPCEGSGETTAYSRVLETVDLELVPGPAPERREPPGTLPYHRLRLLFGLEGPIEEDGSPIEGDQAVLDARAAVLALPSDDQPAAWLAELRRFAALDQIDLAPPSAEEEGDEAGLFPESEPAGLVLANVLGLTLSPDGALSLESDDQPDNTVRLAHVATSTIQELLAGPCGCGAAAGDEGGEEPEEPETPDDPDASEAPEVLRAETDAGGPRVVDGSVNLTARQIAFSVDKALAPASAAPEAFSLSGFDQEAGWSPIEIRRVRVSGNDRRVAVVFPANVELPAVVRLVARGTGPAPLLGADGLPFAGDPSAGAATAHEGNDFAVMQRRN